MKTRLIIATVAALCLFSGVAHAGLLNKNIDFFYIDGTFGGEYEHLGWANPGVQPLGPFGVDPSRSSDTWGIAYGALAGFRIGMLSVGGLYQRTDVMSGTNYTDLNKLYAEVGLNLRLSILMIVLHADLGWAYAQIGPASYNGVGAKGGIAFDFYPIRILSIGPSADFDVQGYAIQNNFAAAYGMTFQLRIGIHI